MQWVPEWVPEAAALWRIWLQVLDLLEDACEGLLAETGVKV